MFCPLNINLSKNRGRLSLLKTVNLLIAILDRVGNHLAHFPLLYTIVFMAGALICAVLSMSQVFYLAGALICACLSVWVAKYYDPRSEFDDDEVSLMEYLHDALSLVSQGFKSLNGHIR